MQYTVYWYIEFGLLCFFLVIQQQKEFVKIFFSNIFIALLLSFPQLIMLYRSSLDTSFFQNDTYYYWWNLDFGDFIVHSILPDGLASRFFPANTYSYFMQGLYFLGIFTIGSILSIYFISKLKKKEYSEKLSVSYFSVAFIFLLYSLGKKGIVAVMLKKLPVFSSFRFLNKPYLIVIPILIVPTIYFILKLDKK